MSHCTSISALEIGIVHLEFHKCLLAQHLMLVALPTLPDQQLLRAAMPHHPLRDRCHWQLPGSTAAALVAVLAVVLHRVHSAGGVPRVVRSWVQNANRGNQDRGSPASTLPRAPAHRLSKASTGVRTQKTHYCSCGSALCGGSSGSTSSDTSKCRTPSGARALRACKRKHEWARPERTTTHG